MIFLKVSSYLLTLNIIKYGKKNEEKPYSTIIEPAIPPWIFPKPRVSFGFTRIHHLLYTSVLLVLLMLPFTTGFITTTPGIELFNNCELAVTLLATAVVAPATVVAPLTVEMPAIK